MAVRWREAKLFPRGSKTLQGWLARLDFPQLHETSIMRPDSYASTLEQKALDEAESKRRGRLSLANAMHLRAINPVVNLLPLRDQCSKAVTEAFASLVALADSISPKIAGTLRVGQAWASIEHDADHPDRVFGSVEFASSKLSNSFFSSSAEDALKMAVEQSLCLAMRDHEWFSYGFDASPMDPEEYPDFPAYQKFYAALPSIGPVGALFASLLQREILWSDTRDDAESYLRRMSAESARAGLLPRCFDGAFLCLHRGCDDDSTWIYRWDAAPGSASFTSSPQVNILEQFDLPRSLGQWELPPLSAGRDALWEALCSHLAEAHASGWKYLVEQRLVYAGFFSSCQAAMDRELISESATQPTSPPRKPRSL